MAGTQRESECAVLLFYFALFFFYKHRSGRAGRGIWRYKKARRPYKTIQTWRGKRKRRRRCGGRGSPTYLRVFTGLRDLCFPSLQSNFPLSSFLIFESGRAAYLPAYLPVCLFCPSPGHCPRPFLCFVCLFVCFVFVNLVRSCACFSEKRERRANGDR